MSDSNKTAPSYARSPSERLRKLLTPGGLLSPLIGFSGKTVGKADLPLDVHLRPNDEVHIYCGHARIVRAQRKRAGTITVRAHNSYREQGCESGLFREWTAGETGFEEALQDYLDNVEVRGRATDKEGRLQAIWSRVSEPWVPFDREAVLAYQDTEQRKERRTFTQVESARSILQRIAKFRPARRGEQWAGPQGTGGKLDQLAVDSEGNLVLIEIKHAATSSGDIYYAPLQLLQYIHEWRGALEWLSIWRQLQEMIDARVELGLTLSTPRLTGGIRAAVCIGEDVRSDEVKRRFYEALGVVNAHLPPGVQPVETWKYEEGAIPEAL